MTAAAVVAGPAIARGAEDDHRYSTPLSAEKQAALLDWKLPDASYLKRVHRVRHNTHQAASRASYRQPLTGDPRTIAHAMLLRDGGTEADWSCLNALWTRESGWSTYAANGGSGAYGIPQALPGSKMATFGADWRTNPITQIRWGLWYIGQEYGSACNALAHSNATGYY